MNYYLVKQNPNISASKFILRSRFKGDWFSSKKWPQPFSPLNRELTGIDVSGGFRVYAVAGGQWGGGAAEYTSDGGGGIHGVTGGEQPDVSLDHGHNGGGGTTYSGRGGGSGGVVDPVPTQ